MTVTLQLVGQDLCFLAAGQTVCRAIEHGVAYSPASAASEQMRWTVSEDAACRTLTSSSWILEDDVRRLGPQLFRWRRRWTNISGRPLRARFHLDFESTYAPRFTLIPGVSYDGNTFGSGLEPKGLSVHGEPWFFAAHRCAVPAGAYSAGGGQSLFTFVESPGGPVDAACALELNNGTIIHRVTWPAMEWPKAFVRRDAYDHPTGEDHVLGAGESFEGVCRLSFNPGDRPQSAWHKGLDDAWNTFKRPTTAWFPPEDLWSYALTFAAECLWVEDDEFVGFSIGLERSGERWRQRATARYEIGWAGQNGALATAFLYDGVRSERKDHFQMGERVLDHWAERGRLPNGLFYTHFDALLSEGGSQGVYGEHMERTLAVSPVVLDTCNLGHGAYQYLQAWELATNAGLNKPLWLSMGLDVCNFFVQHALPDGTFGAAWTPDGRCIDREGTAGAFILWPLLKAFRLTGQGKYLQTAQRAFETYVQDHLEPLHCGGGALDTRCIDKESAFPLLMAGLELYEATGTADYLRAAVAAGYYLASWQSCHSVAHPAGSALAHMAYDTYGGTSVSVAHHCQDPWGSLIALGWLRLWKATGHEVWRERAKATWDQATIGVSDGTLAVNGLVVPVGGQNETYNHTHWGTVWPWPTQRGDVPEWLVAWPSAFRLITLMHWAEWDDLLRPIY